MAQNPRTLERVPVPVKVTVKFKSGRVLKDAVQKALPTFKGSKGDRTSASASAAQSPPPA